MVKANLVQFAFKSPYASKTCADIGKILAEDNSGYDVTTIAKLTKHDKGSIWLALNRLKNDLNVIESFPEYSEKKSAITVNYKFRVKDKYKSQFKKTMS